VVGIKETSSLKLFAATYIQRKIEKTPSRLPALSYPTLLATLLRIALGFVAMKSISVAPFTITPC
jgi:hypothetical protein